MKLSDLKRLSETEARQLLESVRWPEGPVCMHCGNCDQARVGKVKANPAKRVREGLYQCKECRRQFTVTVGTVMEKSKLSLSAWTYIIASMANAKKGVSAKQLQRELKAETSPNKYGNYEAFWFACHRVRHAMKDQNMAALLGGEGMVVEADETFVGGKPRYRHQYKAKDKTPVFTLVQRDGSARSFVTPDVTANTLREHMVKNVDPSTTVNTDEWSGYAKTGKFFKVHKTVKHGAGEYARVEDDGTKTFNNTAESYFSLLKRSVYGTFHNVSPEHLQKYVDELDMKWSTRRMSDVERALLVMKKTEGKRLMYRKPSGITATK